jgi:DNA repair protein SbcD/Mre11
MTNQVRVLLLADTHLGITPRRRGDDFVRNYLAALEPALRNEVDVVVHAGDVFDHPRIKPAMAYRALQPLLRIAESGIPVFIVPGNHERSQLQHPRFAAHARIHVFDRPRTFVVDIHGHRIALAGFPFERNVRTRFSNLITETGCGSQDAHTKLLCIHQCVEGATVGPSDFTFTTAADVIRARDITREFTAVLSGHIHKHQVLQLGVPVIYPGSTERTAFAEMRETKGYMILQLPALDYEFRELQARPMRFERVGGNGLSAEQIDRAIRTIVASAPPDALLRIRVTGELIHEARALFSASHLKTFVPRSMSIDVRTDAMDAFRAAQWQKRRNQPSPAAPQLDLSL